MQQVYERTRRLYNTKIKLYTRLKWKSTLCDDLLIDTYENLLTFFSHEEENEITTVHDKKVE